MTDFTNAERLRAEYLTRTARKNVVNICTGRRNWNVCDYGDVYAGAGCECWKQDGPHNCIHCMQMKREERI